jgi:hypothetical protein
MFAEESFNRIAGNEQEEFEFYMLWDWPEHIEQALRRMLWIALVEEAEDTQTHQSHTSMLRWIIAGYPESPPEVLAFLSDIGTPALLERVAVNQRTSASTLQKLADHNNIEVRLAVADNSNTPLSTLLEMALKAGADVRYRLAENPSLPAKLLQQLAADSNAYVSWRAQRTLARRNPPAVQVFPVRQDRDQQRKAM